MGTYQNAGPGLKKMFIAEVGVIICTVSVLAPALIFFAAIGMLVFMILSLVGLHAAGQDIEGCKNAFIFTIVRLLVSVLSGFLGSLGVIGLILSIAQSILALLITYYVCTSVADVMSMIGHEDVARQGTTVWRINLVCYVVGIALNVVAWIPVLNVLAGIAGVVIGIASLVAGILYMIFLYRSYRALGA